jgi:Flp pilus assembly protein TadD
MYLGAHPLESILATYEARDFTLTQRVLTEFRVVIFYISLLIFPHPSRLNLDHDFALSHSLMDPITTLLSIGALAGLVGLAIFTAKRDRLLSFCILWFLGNLVIESSVIGLEIIFEHRTYLPSMLVGLMAVTPVYRHLKPKWIGLGVVCTVVMVFSVWTYARNSMWSDEVALWTDCVEKSPRKARPHYNLGVVIGSQGKLKEAMSHYTEALRIEPDHVEAHNNLGNALAGQGRLKEAMSHFSEALRIKPRFAEAHNNLGNALANQGRLMQARSHYTEALRIKPDYADAHYNLGVALKRQGRLEEAMSHYYEALRIKPDDAAAQYNLGNVLAGQGRLKEAMSHYSEALRIKPDYVEAHNNLGNALAIQGVFKEAISHYSEALRIRPDYADARGNLERALTRMDKSTGASNVVEEP